ERLLGLQAQVPRPPFVGLWSRVDGFGREDLHRLLHDKAVVRATLMRATLHLMSARDFVALRGSLQPVLTLAMRRPLRDRVQGVDVAKFVDEARAFLHNKPTNFDKLRAHLLTKFPGADERVMGYTVRTQLPLLQVPTGDKWAFPASADFAVAETWLGEKLSD